ncbi:MAG TPA: hypothetical protein VEK85_17170 [Gemmatimonadales bacterium]|nr:hypothetical protein [Gemmatimonadales bacterium]
MRFFSATAQDLILREQATVTYTANQKVAQKLGKGSWLRYMALRLRGAPTLAAASNTNALTKPGDEWAVVVRVDIILGGETVFSMSGEELRMWNRIWYRVNPRGTVVIGDATTANPSFDSVLLIPFATPGLARPQDTALDATDADDFRIEVTWGDHTSINGSASAMTTAPTLVVATKEAYGNTGYWVDRLMTRNDNTATGANSDLRVDLPIGNYKYPAFLIHVEDASGNDLAANVNRIKLKSGPRTFIDIDGETAQQAQMLVDNVEQDQYPTSAGALFYDDSARSSNSNARSWYYIPYSDDGYLTEALDARGLSDLYFSFDVAAACKVTVLAVTIRPNAKAEALDAAGKLAA